MHTNYSEPILIVEDEEEIAQLVSYNLIKAGFHVTCAESGEDGLECVQSEDARVRVS